MSRLEQYYTQTAIPDAPKSTGRVPEFGEQAHPSSFHAFMVHAEEPSVKRVPYAAQALTRVHEVTPLNTAYFSEANVKHIKDEIRYRVWLKSEKKHIIDAPNDDDVKTIMRSYYLQYSGNNPGNVRGELEMLDERTITYCVDWILGEINMYLYYRRDQTNFPEPIANPVNANLTGTKSAEFKAFF
jgi:hypothetical protein